LADSLDTESELLNHRTSNHKVFQWSFEFDIRPPGLQWVANAKFTPVVCPTPACEATWMA